MLAATLPAVAPRGCVSRRRSPAQSPVASSHRNLQLAPQRASAAPRRFARSQRATWRCASAADDIAAGPVGSAKPLQPATAAEELPALAELCKTKWYEVLVGVAYAVLMSEARARQCAPVSHAQQPQPWRLVTPAAHLP